MKSKDIEAISHLDLFIRNVEKQGTNDNLIQAGRVGYTQISWDTC